MNLRKSILVLILSTVILPAAYCQCDPEIFVNSSVSGLTNYNFLKSYRIAGDRDLEKIEFSYVLTKGTEYMLMLRDNSKIPGTVMTIFDNQRHKIATNQIGGQMVSAIAFPCQATGIYYMQYTFKQGSDRCAGSALGFKR